MTTTFLSAKNSVPATTWRLGTAAVIMALALDPLGSGPKAVALAVVFLAGIQVLLSKPVDDTTNTALLTLAAVVVCISAVEILNPNVPSLAVGLIGFRKSATFLLGIVIGLGWRGSRVRGLRLAWWCLFTSAVISLIVHLALPSVEQSIARRSGFYSRHIAGFERMQGILAGPFHVSMLGAFLFISALSPSIVIAQRWVRVTAAAVGLACVYFAQVRAGFAAIAIGALVMTLVTGSAKRWAGRLISIAALSVLAVVFINPLTEYALKVPALRVLVTHGLDDARFVGRYSAWTTSLDLIDRSPLFGSGAGSAGSTLDAFFFGAQHVTPHNDFLKYAVEGGVIQGLLFLLLCIGLAIAVRPRRDPTHFGMAAGLPLLAFASAGSAVDAIPVSLVMAVIVGLCARKEITAPAAGTNMTAYSDRHRPERSLAGRKSPM